MSNLESEFDDIVFERCRWAIQNCDGLAEALQHCDGLFPTIALEHFKRINEVTTARWVSSAWKSIAADTISCSERESFALSTWRFSKSTRGKLSTLLMRGGDRVCLLGTPTLAPYLPPVGRSGEHLLIDVSLQSFRREGDVSFLPHDINLLDGSEFAAAFDICVLDPPWYLEYYLKWIRVAASFCDFGGKVALPLLGKSTRPSAQRDRETIIKFCESEGLASTIQNGVVLYDPPSFEKSMLAREGIPPVRWKKADLLVAERVARSQTTAPVKQPVPNKPLVQFEVGTLVFELVLDRYEVCDVAQGALVSSPPEGFWMKTPSRRERGTAGCNVFVSNGTRFISSRPFDLALRLENLNKAAIGDVVPLLTKLGFPLEMFETTKYSDHKNQIRLQV